MGEGREGENWGAGVFGEGLKMSEDAPVQGRD